MKKLIIVCMVVLCMVTISSYTYADDIYKPISLKSEKTDIGNSFQNIGGIVIGVLQVIRNGNSGNYANYISN